MNEHTRVKELSFIEYFIFGVLALMVIGFTFRVISTPSTVSSVDIIPDVNIQSSLTYDAETGIIYFHNQNGYLPYYSSNGKLCRYQDGKISEINSPNYHYYILMLCILITLLFLPYSYLRLSDKDYRDNMITKLENDYIANKKSRDKIKQHKDKKE